MAKKHHRKPSTTAASPNPGLPKRNRVSTLDVYFSVGKQSSSQSTTKSKKTTTKQKSASLDTLTTTNNSPEPSTTFRYSGSALSRLPPLPESPTTMSPTRLSTPVESFDLEEATPEIIDIDSINRAYLSKLHSETTRVLHDSSSSDSSQSSSEDPDDNNEDDSESSPDLSRLVHSSPARKPRSPVPATIGKPPASHRPNTAKTANNLKKPPPTITAPNQTTSQRPPSLVANNLSGRFSTARSNDMEVETTSTTDLPKPAKGSKKPVAATTASRANASHPKPITSNTKNSASIPTRNPYAAPVFASSARAHQPANQIHPTRATIQRYDLRIQLEPSDRAEHTLVGTLKTIFKELKDSDDSLIIYSWSDDTPVVHIDSPDTHLPLVLGELKKFFPRVRPLPNGGTLWIKVRLGHNLPKDHGILNATTSQWLSDEKVGLWPCSLQTESSVCLGWLLYSTREMSVECLQVAIESQCGFSVGLRHRTILLGRRGAIPNSQKVYAIHVEVEAIMMNVAKQWFSKIYGATSSSGFPNGIKMRLVPELTLRTSAPMRVKIGRLWTRQAAFQAQLVQTDNWDLVALDCFDQDMDATLRDVLMSLRSQTKPHDLSLFHSVDQHWADMCYVFQYIPQFQAEAEAVITGLLTYLKHIDEGNSSAFEKCFTQVMIENSRTSTWDDLNFCVRTLTDRDVEFFLEGDEELDLTEFQPLSERMDALNLTRPDPSNLQATTLYGRDTDSVSTLGTRGTSRTH